MNIQLLPLEKLNPAPYNPRKDLKPGDPEYEALKRSMEEFGLVEPIIWNERTSNIVGGHQRFKVLLAEGITETECVVVDMDEVREKALNIALNKVSGAWDTPLLTDLLQELETCFDVSLTGFSFGELEDLFKSTVAKGVKEDEFDADAAAAEIETPISQIGDVWQLGTHRLMCGDSTIAENVAKLMDGTKARIIFTDPPWNVDYGADAKHPSWKPRQILNDNMSTEEFGAFLTAAFAAMKAVIEPGGMVYVVMSAQEWGNIMRSLSSLGFHWSSTIIWKKDSLVLSRKDYHTQYEPLWYGWFQGKRLYPLKDRKQSDVWEITRPKVSALHPTMKPIELVAKALINSSRTGDIVLDVFGGSGSTLIAAEQTGRICNMMELDEKYCDVIVKRYIESCGDERVYLLRGDKRTHYLDAQKAEN